MSNMSTKDSSTRGNAFLEGLRTAIFEKTGIKLPLTTSSQPLNPTNNQEPPLRVSKISCAAFAVSKEGKLKFAIKPIENAVVVGYSEDMVRVAMWKILGAVNIEAKRRAQAYKED